MVRVLFVCMGNICRSPTAEGVFRALVERVAPDQGIETDSAGTHAFHVGNPPDRRAQQAAARRGVDLGDLRSRQVRDEDFEAFDYLLAMDDDNYQLLMERSPDPASRSKVRLLMEFAIPESEREVPDPYYGGLNGFERVLDLVEVAAQGLLEQLRRDHDLR